MIDGIIIAILSGTWIRRVLLRGPLKFWSGVCGGPLRALPGASVVSRLAAMVLSQGEVPGYAAAYAGEFQCRYGEAL